MSRNLNGMDVDRGRMGKEKRSSLSGHQEDDGSSIEDLLNSISILSFKCIVNCVFESVECVQICKCIYLRVNFSVLYFADLCEAVDD